MPRYIDADALKAEMSEECPDDRMVQLIVMIFNACVDDAPTADVRENRKGEWEEIDILQEVNDISGERTWASKMRCNQCGFVTFAVEGYFSQLNFCPNCGSDNRGS